MIPLRTSGACAAAALASPRRLPILALALASMSLSASAYVIDFSNPGVADGKPIPDSHGDQPGVVNVTTDSVDNNGARINSHLWYKASAGNLSGAAICKATNGAGPQWGAIILRPFSETQRVVANSIDVVSLSGTRTTHIDVYDPITGALAGYDVTVGTSKTTLNLQSFAGSAGNTLEIYFRAEGGQIAVDNINYSVSSGTRTTYHVETNGVDSASRDGRSPSTAWKTLAYACTRVSAGANTIKLGAGTFTETQTARPNSGVAIVGNGRSGTGATRLQASSSWARAGTATQHLLTDYMISAQDKRNITVRNIAFSSQSTSHLANGAVGSLGGQDLLVRDIDVVNFRSAGVYIRAGYNAEVCNSYVQDAAIESTLWGGQIYTHWTSSSDFHDNTLLGQHMGYKMIGSDNIRVFNSYVDTWYFSVEASHEHEFGVQIFGNTLTTNASVPKSGATANPADREYEYTYLFEDNVFISGDPIEGPRGYMIVRNNFMSIPSNKGGAIYAHHGGNESGVIKIHNNVVENVDLDFIYAGAGTADNLKIWNNLVSFRPGPVRPFINVGASHTGWEVKNNIILAPAGSPRDFLWGNIAGITVEKNVFQNVNGVPAGNFNNDPGLNFGGDKPFPYYAPVSASSFVVNRGVNVGLPYSGSAPDIGPYEYSGPAAVVKNAGFENGSNHWSHTSTAWGLDGDSAHSGTFGLWHWDDQPYEEYTYQTVTGLSNGLYTLTAWVWSTGGQTEANMWAGNYGGSWLSRNITGNSTWHQITISNINVTNGQVEVGFWSVSGANNYILVDDVDLRKQ